MVVEPGTLFTFALGALALILVPGPNVMFIVTQSVTRGRQAGLVSALGVEIGSVVHVTAAVLGLSAVLASSATAMTVIKFGGAAYLVFLGLRVLFDRSAVHEDVLAPQERHLSRLFLHGFLVNLFNPKVALFFLAFLPQFVDPSRGSVAAQLMLLGLVFCSVGFCCDSIYAIVSGKGGAWIRGQGNFGRYQRYFTAIVYFALALVALTTRVDRSSAGHR